jgi:ABC-type lipoprotein export system ATPase subunit
VTEAAPLVRCERVSHTYGRGSAATVALSGCDCVVRPGHRVALVGPSGSGKSTLLYVMAGLESPTDGEVSWPAIGCRQELHPARVAMVFQGPSLLDSLSVLENVALPLLLGGETDESARVRATGALADLGLADLAEKLPEELSGGQAQRIAVARALAGSPSLILADEPTGQLDAASAVAIVDILLEVSGRAGAGLIIATHDPIVAERLDERWQMHDGELTAPREPAWSR